MLSRVSWITVLRCCLVFGGYSVHLYDLIPPLFRIGEPEKLFSDNVVLLNHRVKVRQAGHVAVTEAHNAFLAVSFSIPFFYSLVK